jgi:hypothetical protein
LFLLSHVVAVAAVVAQLPLQSQDLLLILARPLHQLQMEML